MAVITNQADSKMKIVYNAGVDDDNKPIVKSKTFPRVKAATSNENLYNLGVAISELQTHELTTIVRYEEYVLMNEI